MKVLALRVGLALFSFVLTLAVMEAVFRVAGIHAARDLARIDKVILPDGVKPEPAPHGFLRRATFRTIYPTNPRGYFAADNHIDHVHNSRGWRDVEHSLKKAPGTYRILGLGDSYLWGQGVRREDIVLTRLGRMLEGRAGGRRIETINTATPNTNTRFQLDLLVSEGFAYDPDLVILHFVLNDVEPDARMSSDKIEFFTNYTSIYLQSDALSRYSYVWGWARQRFLAAYRARRFVKKSIAGFVADSERWAECRAALDDMQHVCGQRHIPLLVVIFPFFHDLDGDYPFQPIHDIVRQHCQKRGIDVLDLREAYRRFHGPELWVHPIDQHPNERAHRVAARAISEHLLRHGRRYRLNVPVARRDSRRVAGTVHKKKAVHLPHRTIRPLLHKRKSKTTKGPGKIKESLRELPASRCYAARSSGSRRREVS